MTQFDSNTSLSSPFIPGAALNIDNLGASGNLFGAGLGCDMKVDRVVLGVFGDYDWFNGADNTISLGLGGFGASTSVKLDNQWTVGGRLGAMVTPGTMAYVLAGYTNLETSDFSITTPFGNGVGAIGDFSGWVPTYKREYRMMARTDFAGSSLGDSPDQSLPYPALGE